MPKKRTYEEQSSDPAAQEMLIRADELGIGTAFSRADEMVPCNIGGAGMCCKLCGMGPCRLTKDGQTGVCGATIDTIQARNLIRAIAAGGSGTLRPRPRYGLYPQSGRQRRGRRLCDPRCRQAAHRGLLLRYPDRGPLPARDRQRSGRPVYRPVRPAEGRNRPDKARACKAPEIVARDRVSCRAASTARWSRRCTAPISATTRIPSTSCNHAIRTSLADGWGGSMIATDVSDILFGTPAPILGQANLGVLKDDMVNVVVHGHEPTLSQMIVAASQDPEIIEYAKAAGAKGVNLSGICCTANEILMRQGIPAAGNFLHQELSILTGAVEAMVVDVQCIMQALVDLASNFHTQIITTSPKVQHQRRDAYRVRRAQSADHRQGDPQNRHRQLQEPRRHAHPADRGRPDPRLLSRIHQLHAGRHLPGFLPPAE